MSTGKFYALGDTLKSLMARPKLMRPMASTRMSRRAPLGQAGIQLLFTVVAVQFADVFAIQENLGNRAHRSQ